MIPTWMDWMLLVAERLGRQTYWSIPWLRVWRRRLPGRCAVQAARRQALGEHLESIGVRQGALVMAHVSVSGLRLIDASQPAAVPGGFLSVAREIVDDLLERVGETGTLVMPTHAHYQSDNDYEWPSPDEPPTKYDPERTPCEVGLANEFFWRRKDVRRSLHPYNTLAARGPLTDELLRDNLNEDKPLPHGVHSAYHRFCEHDGLVVSIGVPLRRVLTLIHVAEEVRDEKWPVKDFWGERSYDVKIDGQFRTVVVRQQRPEFSKFCLCLRKVGRDLVREGILHEGTAEGVRVDWANAREVFQYMTARNENSTYPYYWTGLPRRRR